jgi:uncharacterized membrane protein
MQFSQEDHDAISAAIHAAEARTCGQIVCVLSHASSNYAYVPILWSTVLALLAPWPLIYFTHWSVQKIYLWQLAVFVAAVAHDARATSAAARAGAPGGARAIRRAPDRQYQKS